MNPPPNLPPMIRTDESSWFGHNTMAVRVPAIVGRILDVNPDYPTTIQQSLRKLQQGMVNNEPIPMLNDLAPDYDHWKSAYSARAGDTWLDTSWFYAETFIYSHIIQSVRWWETGRDPFAPIKAEEYASDTLWTLLNSALDVTGSPNEKLQQLFHRVLWGNRIDLSFAAAMKRGTVVDADDLLVDNSQPAVKHLLAHKGTVHLIADNAGTELAMDLALIDAVLNNDLATNAVLHLKLHPTFVSDATPADVWIFLDMLVENGADTAQLGQRLRAAIATGRLRLIPNLYWNSSRLLWDMPPNLHRALQKAALVIIKGDANYRRMVGDAIWSTDTSFKAVVDYFPAPLLALRVLKSEPIVGLPRGLAQTLEAVDNEWRYNGQRGLIQFNV
jgi:uncharacterized protein with ATP-grasp and redox domains